MKWITYIHSEQELENAFQLGFKDVILGHLAYSRFSKNSTKELVSLAKKSQALGLRCHFEWDILMSEAVFQECVQRWTELPTNLFDSVRVQDPGAFEFIYQQTKLPIHGIFETGNHNLYALLRWRKYLGERLQKCILSIELPYYKFENYQKELGCEIEVLVMGPILLFYSPRMLLSPYYSKNQEIQVLAKSEESPHKDFLIEENRHGTFMFHPKDFFVLDHWDKICSGVQCARFDLRFLPLSFRASMELKTFLSDPSEPHGEFLKKIYPKDTLRAFFHVNKSDVLFEKLKNSRLEKSDEDFVGQVVSSQRGFGLVVSVQERKTIAIGDSLEFLNPDGKTFKTRIEHVITPQDAREHLVFLPYMKGVWPKAMIFKRESFE